MCIQNVVEMDVSWRQQTFFCPVCGKPIFGPDGLTDSFCCHVIMIWISAEGCYTYASPALKAILEAAKAEQDLEYQVDESVLGIGGPATGFDPFTEEVQDALPETAILFTLEQQFFCPGPASITTVIGIDFDAGIDPEADLVGGYS